MSSAVNCRATFLFFWTGVNPSIKLSELGVGMFAVKEGEGGAGSIDKMQRIIVMVV
jgi:hypothetical protein